MLTKEDKILIKNVWESKKYAVTRLIKEFPNKKWSKRGVEDFLKRLRSTGSIERVPGSGRCEPHHRRVEASSVGLCRRWKRTFWALLMIATLKITMSKWQHCKLDNWRWLFLFSFAVNVMSTPTGVDMSTPLLPRYHSWDWCRSGEISFVGGGGGGSQRTRTAAAWL